MGVSSGVIKWLLMNKGYRIPCCNYQVRPDCLCVEALSKLWLSLSRSYEYISSRCIDLENEWLPTMGTSAPCGGSVECHHVQNTNEERLDAR